jgi:hypothetical protein
MGPNFYQTVVLILEHGAEGTVGLVLNRATNMLLSEVLPGVTSLKGTTHRLFAGGPVQPNAGAWAVLPPEKELFDLDPATLWSESIARVQAPRIISTD